MKNLFNIDNAFKVLVVLLLSVMAFGANAASLGGSIGYGNDYIFRGQTQTQGSGFAFGSINLDLENGAYAGVWVGEVDFAGGNADAEIDMYAGWFRVYSIWLVRRPYAFTHNWTGRLS